MISLGQQLPSFDKRALLSLEAGSEYGTLKASDMHSEADNRWGLLFWWPKDFTSVCESEVLQFVNIAQEFAHRNTTVVGASIFSVEDHKKWCEQLGMTTLPYAMIEDTDKSLASDLGIIHQASGLAYRTTYIIAPDGNIRWLNINDLSTGRSTDEILRVLDALQSGDFTNCNWQKVS